MEDNYYDWETSKVLRELVVSIATQQPIRGIDLAKNFGKSKGTLSHQLKWLKESGLIVEERTGKNKWFSLNKQIPNKTTNILMKEVVILQAIVRGDSATLKQLKTKGLI